MRLTQLHRRKAERETVENYIQTPYRRECGLTYGIDAFRQKAVDLEVQMREAEEAGAFRVIARLERYMRQQ